MSRRNDSPPAGAETAGTPVTGAEALREAVLRLRAAGVADPARDARLLLAHAAGVEPHRVTLMAAETLPAPVVRRFRQLADRRASREPVSHILGRREFHGRTFAVGPQVLDPRPETETLVAAALAEPFRRVLDLGTGSGVILATLLAERGEARGLGTDISDAACRMAEANLRRLGLSARGEIRRADWFEGVEGRFDLIVSNPPYIAAAEMATLAAELAHEPREALTDEADGLSAYRVIAAGAGAHLEPGGRLLLEIGWKQGPMVREILSAAGWNVEAILPDLDGRDRVVAARRG